MPRESASREALSAAALDLYEEQGFVSTTAAQVAARCGVTERTFFRHFLDKREVLFAGEAALAEALGRAIREAPPSESAPAAASAGLRAVADRLQPRHAELVRRVRVTDAVQALRERELMKLASWTATARDALVERGEERLAAEVIAGTAVTMLDLAARRWLAGPSDRQLVNELDAALQQVSTLTFGSE